MRYFPKKYTRNGHWLCKLRLTKCLTGGAGIRNIQRISDTFLKQSTGTLGRYIHVYTHTVCSPSLTDPQGPGLADALSLCSGVQAVPSGEREYRQGHRILNSEIRSRHIFGNPASQVGNASGMFKLGKPQVKKLKKTASVKQLYKSVLHALKTISREERVGMEIVGFTEK